MKASATGITTTAALGAAGLLALWLDCNSDFYGAYENTAAQARGEVVRPEIE